MGSRGFCFWGFLLLTTTLSAQQYPILPVAQSPKNIERILEDREGRLWIATHDDLLCFDGSRFFSLRALGFPPALSYGLTEDAEGGIVSGSERGVYRYYRGRLEHLVDGLAINELVAVAPGVLLVTATPNPETQASRLYRIRAVSGAWQTELLTGWKTGTALTVDKTGAVLATCPGGWCEFPASLIVNWSPGRPGGPVFHPTAFEMDRILRDRVGCLWFRTTETGAYECPGDRQPVSLPATLAGRNVWAGEVENEDGSMLFASVASLAVGRPTSFQVVSPATGLPPESVSCAVRGRDGTIWVGTLAGLYRFPYPFRLTYWKSTHGLAWSFARSGGAILAGTTAGVARLGPDGQWNILPGSREFGSISSLLSNRDGSVYAAVSRQAVIRLSAEGSLLARTLPGQGGQAEVLARASDGSVWVAGSGIYRLEQEDREIFLAKDEPSSEPPASAAYSNTASRRARPPAFSSGSAQIAADPSGVLWACTPGTLILREAGSWRTIAAETPSLQPCLSLLPLNNGQAWVGYAASFLFALVRPGISFALTLHEFRGGGNSGTAATYAFVEDARGWLWRGSGDGVYVADPAQAQAGAWLHLNDVDGLTELDVNHGSLFSDSDGSLWWGAGTSILHFSPPPDLVHLAAAPRVFPSAFSLGGGPPKLAETVQQFPRGQKLTAHLGSLQFAERNALSVRYRLLPEHKDWQNAAGMDLDLGEPHWGTHILEIQSRFATGPWSPVWSRSLGVLHPWWFTWQSILGFAAFGSFGTAGLVTWRKKRRSRAGRNLPDLAAWRMAALTPEAQLTGTVLDRRFEVRDLVARGGFATIFRGWDRKQHLRPCAIKIFRREVVDEQWHTHRFQQEISALEQIHHPSVVSLYGHGTSPTGAPYLVMEFIEGGTLRDLLNLGPLSPTRAASLLLQAAAALEQIHARGIYHRDLKPENLMLRRGAADGEELVLIDFSIAIVKAPDQTMHGLSRAAGTIYYMAPEQAVGFATPASDVHSLAKIVLEMITGQRLSTLLPHANIDLPDRARELIRGLPIRLSVESVELLASALEFDPAHRPQTAMSFAQPIACDLERASGE